MLLHWDHVQNSKQFFKSVHRFQTSHLYPKFCKSMLEGCMALAFSPCLTSTRQTCKEKHQAVGIHQNPEIVNFGQMPPASFRVTILFNRFFSHFSYSPGFLESSRHSLSISSFQRLRNQSGAIHSNLHDGFSEKFLCSCDILCKSLKGYPR